MLPESHDTIFAPEKSSDGPESADDTIGQAASSSSNQGSFKLKAHYVEFYADWCEVCMELAPDAYKVEQQFVEMFVHKNLLLFELEEGA
ncbi:thioredoxin-like protein [Cucumis melo var. makuwa]|uniref:Thioredoxin-like protein n=1 Tax=Cucumis melo var. makuwa TaxID=1194695 RepID=A0A5A7TL83_CUCMM|nr:thioredoxin-like protein [Cucumis melo var. makuwa]